MIFTTLWSECTSLKQLSKWLNDRPYRAARPDLPTLKKMRTKSHCFLIFGHKSISNLWNPLVKNINLWNCYKFRLYQVYPIFSYFLIGPTFSEKSRCIQHDILLHGTGAWPNQLSWCRARSVRTWRVDLGWRNVGYQNPYWLILGRDFHHEKVGKNQWM